MPVAGAPSPLYPPEIAHPHPTMSKTWFRSSHATLQAPHGSSSSRKTADMLTSIRLTEQVIGSAEITNAVLAGGVVAAANNASFANLGLAQSEERSRKLSGITLGRSWIP